MEQTARNHSKNRQNQFEKLGETAARIAVRTCNGSYQAAKRKRSRMLGLLFSSAQPFPRSALLHLIQVCTCSRQTAMQHGFRKGIASAALADQGMPVPAENVLLPALNNRQHGWKEAEYWNQRNHILWLEQRLYQSLTKDMQQVLSAYLEAEDDLCCMESKCAYFCGWQAGCITALARNPRSAAGSSSHSLFLARYYGFSA